MIPGVLFLNKTYGRKNNVLKYRFRPYDKNLPIEYIPYRIKYSFNKTTNNLFVLVDFEPKGPYIKKVLGPAQDLKSYCLYQLHCKDLIHTEMPFEKRSGVSSEYQDIQKDKYQDRTKYAVFSIDGAETCDFDDAFSIQNEIISVYISNAFVALENFDMWDKFTGYISNIYLPEDRITMLCREVINVCNLKQNKPALALTMDYNMQTQEYSFLVSKIKVYRNYVYEEDELLYDFNYIKIKKYASQFVGLGVDASIDSNKVVEFLMRLMCFKAGETLLTHRCGLYRTLNEPLEDILPSNKYIQYNEIIPGQLPYTHITSPMRRIVDIINQALLCDALKLSELSEGAKTFISKYVQDLDNINFKTKAIKRVQNESMLLYMYEDIKDQIHAGRVLPSETEAAGDVRIYTIFLYELHLIAPFRSCEKMEGEYKFKIYKFDNETNFKKKIRLAIA